MVAVWCAEVAIAGERLAVLELSGKLNAEELGLLTDTIRGAVVKSLGDDIQVMTRENMEVMLTDMGLDADCVSEGACEVETARNLGVDYVVSGGIVSAGGLLIASVKLHETQGGSLKGQEQARGADFIALLDNLPGSASTLVQSLAAATKPDPVPVPDPETDTGGLLRTDKAYRCTGIGTYTFGYRFYEDGTLVSWAIPNSPKKAPTAQQKAYDTATRVPFTQNGKDLKWSDQGVTGTGVLEDAGRIVADFVNRGKPVGTLDCRVVE